MQFGIAVFPSKEVQDVANSYRKRYDPHYSMIQPHMTIREKEEWDEVRLKAAVDHLEKVSSKQAPFSVHFNRFSSFFPVNNVVYMALSDVGPIEQLYQEVCSGDWSEPKRLFVFTPHVTIGQQMNSDELHDVLSSLRSIPLDLSSRIDRLHLLYQTENGAWTVFQTFLLRG